jgi:hypothetical protein
MALHLAQVFDDKYKSGLIELHGAPKAPLGSESGLIELHGAPKVPIGLENTPLQRRFSAKLLNSLSVNL